MEPPLLGLLVVSEELLLGLEELDEPELLSELDEPELMPELDPELMPPEVAPLEAPRSFFLCASHSALLIWPSWLVSISLNSSLPELEAPAAALLPELEPALDGDEPPAADELPPVAALPPVADEPLDDGVLLCDVDGEAVEPELDLLFASSA
ncbi:MAG: hypothetical protein E6H63_08135 [Betaproteobacteria bacterium]|nr:MAG: hypothetical protein E6H63_08135 [Betaproteobacteria bacterium]TMH42577.1 MAG: hypothetical protein E6H54_13775 [Betaproteobacteria bacterium]